jgi:hypothetical protein
MGLFLLRPMIQQKAKAQRDFSVIVCQMVIALKSIENLQLDQMHAASVGPDNFKTHVIDR